MRYLKFNDILEIHRRIMNGKSAIRDLGALKFALAQPRMSFGGQELHPA